MNSKNRDGSIPVGTHTSILSNTIDYSHTKNTIHGFKNAPFQLHSFPTRYQRQKFQDTATVITSIIRKIRKKVKVQSSNTSTSKKLWSKPKIQNESAGDQQRSTQKIFSNLAPKQSKYIMNKNRNFLRRWIWISHLNLGLSVFASLRFFPPPAAALSKKEIRS